MANLGNEANHGFAVRDAHSGVTLLCVNNAPNSADEQQQQHVCI